METQGAHRAPVAKGPELGLDGITIGGLLGEKTYRWSWIYYVWPWPRKLELLVDAPEIGKWGGCPGIHRDFVPALLRHPSFPKWLVSPARARQYGLTESEAADFGPPRDTIWTPGSIPGAARENAELAKLDALKTGFDFTVWVDRVGAFRQGVAFAFQDDIRTAPWDHLVVDPNTTWEDLQRKANPPFGPFVRFALGSHGKDPGFGGDQFFVTLAQAKALLQAPEASWIAVAPDLAKVLGIPPRGVASKSPPR